MERSGLRIQFVRELLVPGALLEAGEIAMLRAGMPNKHERALTVEVLQALEGAGYLGPSERAMHVDRQGKSFDHFIAFVV